MLGCISSVAMYAKLLNIIKDLIDHLKRRIIDINAPTLTHISMDIKHMPPSKDKFLYILVLLCEASNFIVAAPMRTATAPEICNTIMNHFIGYFGTPIRLVCDQDPAFMSHLCQWFFTFIWYTCNPLPAQPTINPLWLNMESKSLSHILMKHLTGLGEDWPMYCKPAMLVYNSYATPNLDNLSPFDGTYWQESHLCPLNLNISLTYLSQEPMFRLKKN